MNTSNTVIDRLLLLARKSFYLIPFLPAAILGILLFQYSVNIPHWDQWTVAQTILKSINGTLQFDDLIAQHNESRKFFPRLLFIALAYSTHYNVRYEILISFLMACLTSVNLFCLQIKTINGDLKLQLFLSFLANLLIFSPIQYEAWLIGLSSVVYIAIACLTSALLIAYTNLKQQLKYIICIVLCVVSTFSFANGLLSWVLVLPVLILTQTKLPFWQSLYRDRWLILSWLVTFATTVILYFLNYQKPAWHPSLTQALMTPRQAIVYFLAFLGNPLGWGTKLNSLMLSELVGAVLFIGFITLIIYLLRQWRDRELWRQSIGWLMLGSYAILSALIATLGRVGLGVEQSLSSRYTTFALYLAVSLIYLTSMMLQHFRTNKTIQISRSVKLILAIALICGLVLHTYTTTYAMQQMLISRQTRLQFKTCFSFINFAADEDCLKQLYWDGKNTLQPLANQLNTLGWLQPPLLTKDQSRVFASPQHSNDIVSGSFDQIVKLPQGDFSLAGWTTWLRQKLPDAVLMTYQNQQNQAILLKVFAVNKPRPDVAIALGSSDYLYSGWEGQLKRTELPQEAISATGKAKLSIWAFDLQQQQAQLIDSRWIQPTE